MKTWKRDEIIERINQVLPEGRVVPRHNENGHFYEVKIWKNDDKEGPIYPSVTGKLQVLKDQGLMNYKMNRAIEYLKNFIFSLNVMPTMEEIEAAAEKASRVSQDILEDAGDIGNRVHNTRERIFSEWIKTGKKPDDFLSFIPAEEEDIRTTSAIRALQSFVEDHDYVPVACELLVFDHDLAVAGTLDDLGLMRRVVKEGDLECQHEFITSMFADIHKCAKCDRKDRYEFVLMDIKTSNQFKDHYFFQVALYWRMLWRLLGKSWKPERAIIVKLSKTDGSYKIEELKKLPSLAQYALHMLKTNEAVDFIKSIRKDNQKVVAPLMEL